MTLKKATLKKVSKVQTKTDMKKDSEALEYGPSKLTDQYGKPIKSKTLKR